MRAVFGDVVPSSVSLAKKNVDIAFKVTADGVVVLGLAKGERAQACQGDRPPRDRKRMGNLLVTLCWMLLSRIV